MRILHVVPTYLPAVRYGGPIFSVHGLLRALATAGHDVHVFTTNVDGVGVSNVPLNQPVTLDAVKVHYFESRHLRRLYYSPGLRSMCARKVGAFDVVHLHSVFLYPTAAAARVARKLGVPYVVSPRGMLVRELIDRRSALAKWAWIAAVERRNLRAAAFIHLTSEAETRALAELGLELAPTVVIANGVNEPPAFLPGDVSEDVRAVCARGFDILCFGRINWKKGLDRAIRAMPLVPGATLLIAGHDEDRYADFLRALAVDTGVLERVSFLPRQISGADMEALFAAARVLALPSLSENFGNVVVEALVRGIPVAVTTGVGAAAIVTSSGAGVVTEPNDAQFAVALTNLLASDERRRQMGRAGAAYVKREHNWMSIARRFESLYESVVAVERQTAGAPVAGAA